MHARQSDDRHDRGLASLRRRGGGTGRRKVAANLTPTTKYIDFASACRRSTATAPGTRFLDLRDGTFSRISFSQESEKYTFAARLENIGYKPLARRSRKLSVRSNSCDGSRSKTGK